MKCFFSSSRVARSAFSTLAAPLCTSRRLARGAFSFLAGLRLFFTSSKGAGDVFSCVAGAFSFIAGLLEVGFHF